MASRIKIVFVFPIIQKNYIKRALETLYQFTPYQVRTIVIDQTKDGIQNEVGHLADMIIRVRRNLGFAKAMNEGIIHGLHWGAEYVSACNDDVEFLDERWLSGVEDFWKQYPEMLAVNPCCPIEPGWGYGIGIPNHTCPDWGVVVGKDIYPKKPNNQPLTYEESKTKQGYDWLINGYKQGHIEGFAGWCVIMKREGWEKIGLYDERFYPGGGEDYDLCHRVYIAGGRAAATTKSWMWHWWGKSKEIVHISKDKLPNNKEVFQNTNGLFEYSPEGANSPIYPPRDNEPQGNKRRRKSKGIFVEDIR